MHMLTSLILLAASYNAPVEPVAVLVIEHERDSTDASFVPMVRSLLAQTLPEANVSLTRVPHGTACSIAAFEIFDFDASLCDSALQTSGSSLVAEIVRTGDRLQMKIIRLDRQGGLFVAQNVRTLPWLSECGDSCAAHVMATPYQRERLAKGQ